MSSLISSEEMDVFVIPVGRERYELYSEQPDDEPTDDPPPTTFIGRMRHRFSEMLKAAEERRHRTHVPDDEPKNWAGRMQDRLMAWVVERIAEQQLLWSLRRQTAAVAAHPQDMTFEQVQELIRTTLQRDFVRHRKWLVIDTLGLVASAAVMPVPGPNLLAYYFTFRVVGHWLSMKGAAQGLHHITWSSRPCAPLSELREVAAMEPRTRDHHIRDIAARLRLQHLSTFFDRVAIRPA